MKKIALVLAGAALTAVAMPASAVTNLVTNGGFESTTSSYQNFQIGFAGSVNGWSQANGPTSGLPYNLLFNSATATTVDAVSQYPGEQQRIAFENYGGASPDGGNFVALDGDTGYNGYLYQTISGLTAGKTYRLTFNWAGTQLSNRGGATTERIAYNLGNSYNFDPLTSATTTTIGGPTHYFDGWRTETATFVAGGSSQVLSFLSVGTPNGLPPVALLDGVSLAAVPEPAAWALMLFGFGGLGVAARRRRAATTVYA